MLPDPTHPAVTATVMEFAAPSAPAGQSVTPRCVHFGTCGGCQYQNLNYEAQLASKAQRLQEIFAAAGLSVFGDISSRPERGSVQRPSASAETDIPAKPLSQTALFASKPPAIVPSARPPLQVWPSPDPYFYRNRIRLRVRRIDGQTRLGYSLRGSNEFLPITMCPIAAPILWRAAEALMVSTDVHLQRWLDLTVEAELFTNPNQTCVQLTLFCATRKTPDPNTFHRALKVFQESLPELTGAGAHRVDPQSGRTLGSLAQWGTAGFAYPVDHAGQVETYWITRGGFFQVNRFLLPRLVDLVCADRTGALAWDLFAGVGLFSRPLAQGFSSVTAVEANPIAAADLSRALAKVGLQHRALESTTLDFLRAAVLQRDRPDLIVLDPPRAGVGAESCHLLNRIAAPEVVYLSCDPSTLARDLAILTPSYRVEALHLVDLFPQTLHIETLAILRRT